MASFSTRIASLRLASKTSLRTTSSTRTTITTRTKATGSVASRTKTPSFAIQRENSPIQCTTPHYSNTTSLCSFQQYCNRKSVVTCQHRHCYDQKRLFTSSSSSNKYQSFKERLHNLKTNGTPEIWLGYTLLGLLLMDQVLQTLRRKEREAILHQLEVDYDTEEKEKKRRLQAGQHKNITNGE